MARRSTFLVVVLCSIGVFGGPAIGQQQAELAGHPSELTFGALSFEVPDASSYRHTLSNGIPVFIAEDHALPLIDLSITVRIGSFLEPDDRSGVASLTGQLMRDGGTAAKSAEAYDERVDFLASNVFTFIGDTSGAASMNSITGAFDETLDLFFEMLKTPGFQQDRLDVAKDELLESMKQRNDHPRRISSREWQWLIRGRDHFTSQVLTAAQLEAITREDLIAFHKSYWRPENMIIAVAGDVDTKEVLAQLERHFEGWDVKGPKVSWPPPKPDFEPTPGVYYVDKEIPQGWVRIGHLGLQRKNWDDPENFALAVMNDILGGGGFTSRLVKRIRSDEGLAYAVGSRFGIDTYWPGEFLVSYQSKSATVAFAGVITQQEIEKMRTTKVSDQELTTSKNSFIEIFPRRFESADQIVGTFANDLYSGRPHTYWQKYRDRIRAVTADNVQKVAEKHLHADRLLMLIVGTWGEIEPGDADGRASMKQFADGKATELPLLDPLTLKPLE